ncbi:MAG: hypothetical protein MI974_04360, partial [Chitinophagales bacterium]|nr:hypothetical protein [Chitinophagales bacterium]
MVFQSNHSSQKESVSTVVRESSTNKNIRNHQWNFSQANLHIITLGNPQKECRHFGICKIDAWENKIRALYKNQCLAHLFINNRQMTSLKGIFLHNTLIFEAYNLYFNPYFLVEASYCLEGIRDTKGNIT